MSVGMLTTHPVTTHWWHLLLQGIMSIIVGILLVISPGVTTVVLVQILGIYWLVTGILSLVSLFLDRSMWGWKLVAGILGILAGISIVRHPLWSGFFIPFTIVIFLGVQGLIQGVIGVIQALQWKSWGTALLGIVNIIFGLFILSAPFVATAILPIVLGIVALITGIVAVFGAFRVRRQKDKITSLQSI